MRTEEEEIKQNHTKTVWNPSEEPDGGGGGSMALLFDAPVNVIYHARCQRGLTEENWIPIRTGRRER